jgi:hypothetical protein
MEDTNWSISLSSFVIDPDGDPLIVEGPFGAEHGIVEIVDRTALELSYAPHSNFVGTDNFKALVTDGNGGALEVL